MMRFSNCIWSTVAAVWMENTAEVQWFLCLLGFFIFKKEKRSRSLKLKVQY